MADKKTATESKLGELHAKVADIMVNTLDYYERTAHEHDERVELAKEEQNPELLPITERPIAPPALLTAITKFLADNKITCAPEDDNSLSELEDRLAKKRKRGRRGLAVVGGVDMSPEDD